MTAGRLVLPMAALLLAPRARAGTVFVALPAGAVCTADEIAGALVRRLPGTRVAPGLPASAADVGVALTPGDSHWSLTVRASGEAALSRELPSPPSASESDCAALAETSALIVERYLAAIAWSGDNPALAPLQPAARPVPVPWKGAVDVGVGGTAGLPAVEPSARLEVEAWHGRLVLAASWAMVWPLDVALPAPQGGTLQVFSGEGEVAGGVRLGSPVGAFVLTGFPGLGVFWGAAQGGALFQRRTTAAVAPDLGVRAAWELGLGRRFVAGLRLTGRVYLTRSQFEVDGESAAFETPLAEADAEVTLGVVVF